jgi:hypothetical protein
VRLVPIALAALALFAAPALAQTGPINGGRQVGSGSHPPDTNGPRNATGEYGGAPTSNCPPGGTGPVPTQPPPQ